MAGYENLQQVAQVLKSNGTDGELVMSFREIAPEDINLQEPVFIIFDGLPVPFYIESFTKRGNSKALVRLTDICSMEDVDEIAGKAVYIEEDQIPEMSLEEDGFAALVGWTVLTPWIPDEAEDETDEEEGLDEGLGDEEGLDDEELGDDTDEEDGDDTDEEDGDDTDEEDEDEEGLDEEGLDEDEMEGGLYEVGEITDFFDIPNNPCIEVATKNGAVMLPLHEDLILSIDPENLEIIMQIPAGLL